MNAYSLVLTFCIIVCGISALRAPLFRRTLFSLFHSLLSCVPYAPYPQLSYYFIDSLRASVHTTITILIICSLFSSALKERHQLPISIGVHTFTSNELTHNCLLRRDKWQPYGSSWHLLPRVERVRHLSLRSREWLSKQGMGTIMR